MAIDKRKAKKLLEDIDNLYKVVSKPLPNEGKKYISEKIMKPLYDIVEEMIVNTRSPVIFTVGRSGHGKSSILNALANREIAEVGDIKPTTIESVPHEIDFSDKYSKWTVVDTRGIFETTTPEGALELDAVELLKSDIKKYKPDIILHIVSASEIRNLSNDLLVFKELTSIINKNLNKNIPIILVINKVDTLGNPRHWPIEEYIEKKALIDRANLYMIEDVLNEEKFINIYEESYMGYKIIDSEYKAVVPVCSLKGDEWNIDNLSNMIGENLPDEALLDFYQAQGRKDQLKELSSKVINLFSTVAGAVALSPVPISDIIILTPLQMLMISIIGGLSCREFSKDTAKEYLLATGANIGAAFGFKMIAQQVVKLVPGAGSLSSSAIAASGTYAIGKSAEAYFFSGEIKDLKEFKKEWEDRNKGE